MEQLKLRTYDGIALAGFLTFPPLFCTGLAKLTEQNNSAAWIALLLASALILGLLLILLSLIKQHENKNIIAITFDVLGRPCGIIFGLALSLYFCYFTGIQIRESAEILKIYTLHFTPVYVIVALILLTAVLMNFWGGRAIAKSAGFFFIIIISGIIFVILLGINLYNPDNLVPVLGNGINDLAKKSLFMTSLFDGAIILGLFAPAFSNPGQMKKSGLLSVALTSAAYISLSICYIMMFPPSISSTMMSGFIEMGKSSYYNHFFYRFESILLFFLIFSSAMLASIGLFIAKESILYTFSFKASKTKFMVIICMIPILASALIPANILELTQTHLPLIRQYSILFIAGFPLLILIIGALKRVFKT